MKGDQIGYASSHATEKQLFDHLLRCDGRYHPPLSQRVDIAEYAHKLRTHAETLEAWHVGELVGVVAIYINEAPADAFISSVSVDDEFAGLGIGSHLVSDAVALARLHGANAISLNVSPQSRQAIQVYQKHGFRIIKDSPDTLHMQLSLSEQAP